MMHAARCHMNTYMIIITNVSPSAGPRFIGSRGDSGHGWYKLYEEEGPEGFQKYRPPTPFDWEAASPEEKAKRTHAFLDVSMDK